MSKIPRIQEVQYVEMSDLVIGKAQARTRGVSKDIEELAESIKTVGLLEPIVVAESTDQPGKFEIITGQRRFLAHVFLKEKTILAAILDGAVSEIQAKILSVTENLVRRDLENKDLIDVCTYLYKQYGTFKAVAEETGLPYATVSRYVKYEQLVAPLKDLVDKGTVSVATAIRAQKAASVSGEVKETEAVEFAKSMASMSGAQQAKIVNDRRTDPSSDASAVIEDAKSGGKITQVVVTISANIHKALQSYAKEQDTNQDDAARALIEQGLETSGFLAED